MKSLLSLGKRQRRVLEIVWKRGETTVERVREDLVLEDAPLAYTTVLTVFQNLERAGWVRHRRVGRRYRYAAATSRTEALRRSAETFVTGCDGDDALEFARAVLRCHAQRNRPMTMLDRVNRRRMAS